MDAGARGIVLSWLAGYVDTLVFILLAGLFTAHVTGNFVLVGRELVQSGHDVQLKLLAFPAFVAGVAATRLLVLRWQVSAVNPLRHALLLQLLLLLAAAGCGLLAGPPGPHIGALASAAGLLAAAAMGVQNAYGKLLLPAQPMPTVMTGNVTQLVIALIDAARARSRPPAAALAVLYGVLAFALGCCCGALACWLGLGIGLLAPCVALLLLAWRG